MDWQDDGLVLGVRRHGEGSAIVDLLTPSRGRHAGLVRGATSRRLAPHLQPGTTLCVTWRARLEDHLGTYTVEPRISRAGLMSDRLSLAGLTSVTALLSFAMPEREPAPDVFEGTSALLDAMEGPDWLGPLVLWERALLTGLGFGLDFSRCAATGAREGLIYVSPKSGRAVSRAAAADWADRLLPLPAFLRDGQQPADSGAVGASEALEGLRTTGYFLEKWLCPALGKAQLPPARLRFVETLARRA